MLLSAQKSHKEKDVKSDETKGGNEQKGFVMEKLQVLIRGIKNPQELSLYYNYFGPSLLTLAPPF